MRIDAKRQNTYLGWSTFLLCLLLGGLISLLRGQDNWWDIANYHIYNPWSLLHDRWEKDLYAAGIQGYFHPWLDIPYYLMAMEWFPSRPRLVSFLAGLPYGYLVFIVFQVTRSVFRTSLDVGTWERRCLTVATTLLAVTGVSAWTQAGTTTNEVTVAALVLSAVHLFFTITPAGTGAARLPRSRFMAIGALLGVAAGLKLTAAVYAPAMGLAIIFQQRAAKPTVRALAAYVAGFVALFAVTYGPWAWHLYKTTGNPLFPMFANVFVSPFSAPSAGRDVNFLPADAWEWIFYPFYWLSDQKPTVYNKLLFRDGRIAAFYVASIAYLCASRWLRAGAGKPATRSLPLAVFFCAASYVVWLVLFSMLRYAIVIEALASITTIGIVVTLLTRVGDRLVAPRSWAVAALTFLLLAFTHYPDVPRIGYADKTFSSNAPHLPQNPLIVLANQPMGLLAPLIQAENPSASFLGISECFTDDMWCNQRFLHYGLGARIKEKLSTHRGPLFVAYYTSRNPPLPQLPLFGVHFSRQECMQMRTNTTGPVSLCAARYAAPGAEPAPRSATMAQAGGPQFTLVFPTGDVEKGLQLNYKTYQRPTDESIEVLPLPPGAAIGTLVSLTAPHEGSLHLELGRRECTPGVDVTVYRADKRESIYHGQVSYAGNHQAADVKIAADRYPAEFVLDFSMPASAQHNWFCNVSTNWRSRVLH